MARRQNNFRILGMMAAVIAVVLVVAGMFGPTAGWMQGGLSVLAAPVHSGGSFVRGLFGKAPCRADQALAERVESLVTENSRLSALAAENEALKSALRFEDSYGDRAVIARVIYESDDTVSQSLVLNRGSADGLAVGQPVITGNGLLAGKIASVRKRTASVMPLTDTRSKVAVTVQNSQETLGVLSGERNLSLAMRLVPQTETLAAGQAVITSGLESGIRRGLIVGTIDRIDRPPREPFQSATVIQFEAARHPMFVMVLIPDDEIAP